jgi:carbonic anhydrase/acetyltransferase-like protein (isoleucine patch superfamily)
VIKEGMIVPPRSLVVGVPGRIIRTLGEPERQAILHSAADYRRQVELYLPSC